MQAYGEPSDITSIVLLSAKADIYSYRYANFTECVQHTYKSEGVKGFWRGESTFTLRR